MPKPRMESDFGELLLYLVSLADKVGVDLIDAGQNVIDRRAPRTPALLKKP